jgi:hypothetical protein
MAFRVYKPKNVVKVRAEQVTEETIQEIADRLMGRVSKPADPLGKEILEVPTLKGIVVFEIGTWILRNDENEITKMSNAEFEKTYEVARNVSAN